MERQRRARRVALLIALALGAIAVAACDGITGSDDATPTVDVGTVEARVTGPLPSDGNLLFVLRGPATITGDVIEIDAETVEWFTDRPQRQAGTGPLQDLIENWSAYGFADDPPNAALTGAGIDAVVVLTDPRTTSGGVAFAFSTLTGELQPGQAETVSVFIDSSANRCYIDVHNNTLYGWGRDADSELKPAARFWSEGAPGGGPDTTIAPGGSIGSAFNAESAYVFFYNTTYPDDDPYGPKGDGSYIVFGTSCEGNTHTAHLHCDFIGPANDHISCHKRSSGRHAIFTLEPK